MTFPSADDITPSGAKSEDAIFHLALICFGALIIFLGLTYCLCRCLFLESIKRLAAKVKMTMTMQEKSLKDTQREQLAMKMAEAAAGRWARRTAAVRDDRRRSRDSFFGANDDDKDQIIYKAGSYRSSLEASSVTLMVPGLVPEAVIPTPDPTH